jgi:ribosomal protein S19E (S16A)
VIQGLRSGNKLSAGHRCWRFDDGSADRVECKTVQALIEKGLIVANKKGCALTPHGRHMVYIDAMDALAASTAARQTDSAAVEPLARSLPE